MSSLLIHFHHNALLHYVMYFKIKFTNALRGKIPSIGNIRILITNYSILLHTRVSIS